MNHLIVRSARIQHGSPFRTYTPSIQLTCWAFQPRQRTEQRRGLQHSTNSSTSAAQSARVARPTNTDAGDGSSAAVSSTVNPPLSTLPPPLDLPERPQDTSPYNPKHLFRTGKAYLNFYKQAVVAIWRTRNRVIDIRLALPASDGGSFVKAAAAGHISRAEFQMQARSGRDVVRVPFFGLIFIICGEFTPLVVLLARGAVPPSAWIPKQVAQYRRQLEERRAVAFRLVSEPVSARTTLEQLSRMQLLLINASCNVTAKAWELLFPGAEPGLPTRLLLRRVRRWIEYLSLDSDLLKAGGGPRRLSEVEVTQALMERGVDVLKYDAAQQKDLLVAWEKSWQSGQQLKTLLSRPAAWPFRPNFLLPKKS